MLQVIIGIGTAYVLAAAFITILVAMFFRRDRSKVAEIVGSDMDAAPPALRPRQTHLRGDAFTETLLDPGARRHSPELRR
jgi:hypothetical protein